MDAKELLDQIEAYQGKHPRVRYVPEVYAAMVAKMADNLTAEQLEDMVALGALIKNRCSVLVPVYKFDQIPDHILGQGRAVG
ncbi:hypothetical protein COAQ111491_21990 [Comamonas aquatilis]|uniref:hypothetical protein n=1 Tax=Comamonas aquatilis TaxID=1778406 RepID=UPI0039EEA118